MYFVSCALGYLIYTQCSTFLQLYACPPENRGLHVLPGMQLNCGPWWGLLRSVRALKPGRDPNSHQGPAGSLSAFSSLPSLGKAHLGGLLLGTVAGQWEREGEPRPSLKRSSLKPMTPPMLYSNLEKKHVVN